jgi:mRNA-degrading endonuclease RelE of RelBE toxin-antitoxin system
MALTFKPGTLEYLATLAPAVRRDLRKALRILATDARSDKLDLRQLRVTATGRYFRVRVGRYRIVYTPRAGSTYVARIMHRSEGYAWLEKMDPI